MNKEGKKTILLVEDELLIAMMEMEDLQSKGYIVHHVNTGEKAVKIIIDNGSAVDLILMDIDLGPGIDGTQAAEKILGHKDIPIIFLSCHTEPEIVEKTEKITSYGYVVKNSGIIVLDASIKMGLKLFQEKTEKKLAENKLNKERELLDYIMSVTGTGYDIIDGKFNIHYIDNNWRKIYGDPTNRKCYEYFHNFSGPCPGCGIPKALETKEIIVTEEKLTRENNRIVEVHTIPFLDSSGQWMVAEFNIDITQRKLAEEVLEQERNLYRDLVASQPSGVYRLRIMGQKTWKDSVKSNYRFEMVSDRFCEILGATREQCEANASIVVESIHPDDSQGFIARNVLALETMEPFFWEGRIKVKDRITWVYMASVPRRLIGGDVIWTGIILDISDRKKIEKEIQRQLAEKEIMLREVHHRIKNNMAIVQSMLSLQERSTENPEAKTVLKDSIARIESIRILYDKLQFKKDFHDIAIKPYVESLLDSISAVFVMENKIAIQKQITDFSIDSKKAISLGIIINELISNIMKYAFTDIDKGVVKISIEKTDNIVTLIIQDNGTDEKISPDKSPGLGKTIIKMLVQQLNGTYSSVIDNGTKSIIQFEI